MLVILALTYLYTLNIECERIQPIINTLFLETVNYDGEGIPELVYCEIEKG